jgi:hypothetical protein
VGNYFSDIVKLAKEIQMLDEGHPKGTRSIESSKVPFLLSKLNFNRDHPFDNVLYAQPVISFSADKKSVTLTLDQFNATNRLHWYKRYGSYRFALVIAQLPDFLYSEATTSFSPAVRDLEQLSVCTYTEWYSFNGESKEINLEVSFANPALQQPGTMVIVAMGIEISAGMLSATDSYTSAQGTMKIVECFV